MDDSGEIPVPLSQFEELNRDEWDRMIYLSYHHTSAPSPFLTEMYHNFQYHNPLLSAQKRAIADIWYERVVWREY